MTEDKNTKQRIFDAAVSLFARKGYGNVGIREIVKKAKANIAMVNYYYGGKVGILKEIIQVTFNIRKETILKHDLNRGSIEERTKSIIRAYIEFLRNHTELALVAFGAKVNEPDIIELQEKLSRESYELVKIFFDDIGLDMNDFLQRVSLGGIMNTVIYNHFHAIYEWSTISEDECCHFDDKFYKQYAEILAHFYLYGVKGVVKSLKNPIKKR